MSAPRVSLRLAVAADAAAMVEVHHAAVQAVDRRHYGDEVLAAWSPPPDSRRRDWLADLVGQASTLCTVAVACDGAIAGFCIALPEQALLKALYVHPDCNGQGIGHALLQEMEERCRALGIEVLELNASHNAEAFYRRCGYQPQGAVTQPLTDTVAMAATRMVKRLDHRP
jgi:putative acetyltransferase